MSIYLCPLLYVFDEILLDLFAPYKDRDQHKIPEFSDDVQFAKSCKTCQNYNNYDAEFFEGAFEFLLVLPTDQQDSKPN